MNTKGTATELLLRSARQMKLLLFLTLLLLAPAIYAGQEAPFAWRSVSIGLDPDPEKHFVRAAVRDGQFTELSLHTDQGAFVVPPGYLASLSKIRLGEIRVWSAEAYWDTPTLLPYECIEVRYGTPTLGEYPRAMFMFYSGKFQRLCQIIKQEDGTMKATNFAGSPGR